MILTGSEIYKNVQNGKIIIDPFCTQQLNPNSYNFRLGKRIIAYENHILDPYKNNPTKEFVIPESGITLYPNTLYLGHTEEKMGSEHYVPIIRGRSSTGRLGLFVHITADLIDIGSINQWTLQMYAVQPITIYPGMLIGQVTFWQTTGDITLYKGKYQGSMGPVASLVHKDCINS
jgi:dCTP deaminase